MTQANVTLYGSDTCSYCSAARMLLKKKGISWQEVAVAFDPEKRQEMFARSGRRTVPQIFINDQPIGGFDELYALEKNGELDRLLSEPD